MTYYVGIDIAKFKHDCFIMTHEGEVIMNSFSFPNTMVGFSQLLQRIKSLDQFEEIRIGFEATGNYGVNLKNFLEIHQLSFVELHPLLIKHFASATTLRRTKTDKVDAQLIALYLTTITYNPYPTKSYHIRNLKSLTRTREALVKQRSQYLVRLTNMLDMVFPEFKPFFKNSLSSSTCMYLLDNYSVPSKISKMNLESYQKMVKQLHHSLSYARFLELKQLAKTTVGVEDPIITSQIEIFVEMFNTLKNSITKIDALIKEEFMQINTHILSIKGIGLISAASIYCEFGGIEKFDSPDKMLAFAGLEPSLNQSGTANFKGHMVKHGSSYLRQTLMNVAEFSLIHNPILYDFYKKKKLEGKHHLVALSHVAKRIVRIIYHLEKNNIDFDITKMR